MSAPTLAYFISSCDPGLWILFKEEDLNEPSKVKRLFDLCKQSENPKIRYSDNPTSCVIYEEGWKYLIGHYGFEKLFEINREVDWLDTDAVWFFKINVEQYIKVHRQKTK